MERGMDVEFATDKAVDISIEMWFIIYLGSFLEISWEEIFVLGVVFGFGARSALFVGSVKPVYGAARAPF